MGSLRAALVFLAATSLAPADLTLDFELEAGGEKHQTRMQMAGGRIRFDAAQASTIVLPAENRTLMLFHGTRTYSSIQQDDALGGLAEIAAAAAAPAGTKPPKVSRTGAKAVVSGLECEQVIVQEPDGSRDELWISPQAPSLSLMGGEGHMKSLDRLGMGVAESWKRWMHNDPSLSTVPVRSIVCDARTNEVCRTTLTAFNTNSIAAEQFQAPAGYSPADLPLFGLPTTGGQMQQLESQTQEMEEALKRLGEELKKVEVKGR